MSKWKFIFQNKTKVKFILKNQKSNLNLSEGNKSINLNSSKEIDSIILQSKKKLKRQKTVSINKVNFKKWR